MASGRQDRHRGQCLRMDWSFRECAKRRNPFGKKVQREHQNHLKKNTEAAKERTLQWEGFPLNSENIHLLFHGMTISHGWFPSIPFLSSSGKYHWVIAEGGINRNSAPFTKRWTDSPGLWTLAQACDLSSADSTLNLTSLGKGAKAPNG